MYNDTIRPVFDCRHCYRLLCLYVDVSEVAILVFCRPLKYGGTKLVLFHSHAFCIDIFCVYCIEVLIYRHGSDVAVLCLYSLSLLCLCYKQRSMLADLLLSALILVSDTVIQWKGWAGLGLNV